MKSYGMSLVYLFTWRMVIIDAMFLGLLLFAVALATFVFGSYLEAQLWINIALVFCLTPGSVLISTLLGKTELMYYSLLIVACAFYDGYHNLRARVYGWSSPSQALVLLISQSLVVTTVIAAIQNPALNLVFVIEIGIVTFTLLFRTLSKIRFGRVDWQVLNPALNKCIQAAS